MATTGRQLEGIPPDVRNEWYDALWREDCVEVLKSLAKYPYLIIHGWQAERVDYADRDFSIGGGLWKGRTALHVGARRGCPRLVDEALRLISEPSSRSSFVKPGYSVSLGNLLEVRDGQYNLDALAIAVIIANKEIIQILMQASLRSAYNPYEISPTEPDRKKLRNPDPYSIRLEGVMKALIHRGSEDVKQIVAPGGVYHANEDFNFLPWEQYLFHFTFCDQASLRTRTMIDSLTEVRKSIVREVAQHSLDLDLLGFLFKLKDGQGRTPLHVAVDYEWRTDECLKLIPVNPPELSREWVNSLDSSGRTPLQRAATIGHAKAFHLLVQDLRSDFKFAFKSEVVTWVSNHGQRLDLNVLSKRHGFGGGSNDLIRQCESTVLQTSIIHRRRECVSDLLYAGKERPDAVSFNKHCMRQLKHSGSERRKWFELPPLELSALVGYPQNVRQILTFLSERESSMRQTGTGECPPAIHLAAISGKFELLNEFLDHRDYNHLMIDGHGLSALDYAVKGKKTVEFEIHLLEYATCKHAAEGYSKLLRDRESEVVRKGYIERQGCINLLLQAGCDIWKDTSFQPKPWSSQENFATATPQPGSDAPSEFLSWWYEKLTTETTAIQNTLNNAANAITVTAALVATTTFVGPLQPPSSYKSNPNNTDELPTLQVSHGAIRIFIVCDTLSFYFALASIMLALIPALPMSQRSVMDEIRFTRRMVNWAVACLFPSIVCLLVGFAAGSIAVIPEPLWNYGGLTASTAIVGALICLPVILMFSTRLVRLGRRTKRKLRL